MPIETTTRISIHPNKNYYYTVEDEDISTSTDGITISYYEKESDSSEVRVEFLTMTNEVALAIADAIYKLQKRTNDATN
jgi:hypothetical protein